MFCFNWYCFWADALLATSTGFGVLVVTSTGFGVLVVNVRKNGIGFVVAHAARRTRRWRPMGGGRLTIYKPGWSDSGSSLFLHKLSELIHTHASLSRRHLRFLIILSHSTMLYSGTKTKAVGSSSSGGSEECAKAHNQKKSRQGSSSTDDEGRRRSRRSMFGLGVILSAKIG